MAYYIVEWRATLYCKVRDRAPSITDTFREDVVITLDILLLLIWVIEVHSFTRLALTL